MSGWISIPIRFAIFGAQFNSSKPYCYLLKNFIMANPLELTRYIRYQLSELTARNAHHEFENLTRNLARIRICSNIIPATGPVSAGGDGGRDFETFKTYNDTPVTPDSSFYRLASGQREIAFACSLQQDLITKIREELKKIKSHGKYANMVFFGEKNIPVAKRHALQKEAKDLEIDLQIFDGTAIAELLSDRDTFWIAQSYLQIPLDLIPASNDNVDWYQDLAKKWRSKQPIPFSYSNFSEVKFGVRHSTFHEDARPDLIMWIGKLQAFREKHSLRELHRWASYEVIVASFRGMASLDGVDTTIIDYFSDLEDYLGLGDLSDAVNLSNYLIGAYGMNLYPVSAPSLPDIQERLVAIFEAGIIDAPGPGRRAELLRLLGIVNLLMVKEEKVNLETVAGYWNRMLDEAEQTNFFPAQKFNEYYTQILHMLESPEELADLAPRLDELIAKRSGSKEAGENAEKRGDKQKEQKNIALSLKEYQRSRSRFYTAGDESALIRISLKMADSFRSLGLSYAAKYYALSAAWMSANPSKPTLRKHLPDALLSASEMDYSSGNFLGFAHYTYLSRTAELMHGSVDSLTPIAENVGHIYGLLGILKRKSPEHYKNIIAGFTEWPTKIFGDILEISSNPGFWNEDSIDKITLDMSPMLIDRPWGDLAKTRVVRWTALGINWRCTFENNYTTNVAAENLISQIQMASSAIFVEKADLILIPTNLNLSISIDNPNSSQEIGEIEFDGSVWNLEINLSMKGTHLDEYKNRFSALAIQIISNFSLLKIEDYLSNSSAWVKTFQEIGFNFRSYEEVMFEFTPQGPFTDKIKLASKAPFDFLGIGTEFKILPEFSGIAPNYNLKKQLEIISKRYEAAIPNIQYTVRNLLTDARAVDFFNILHSDGMKDWYLLCIISGMALTARGTNIIQSGNTSETTAQLLKIAEKTETIESALKPDDFDLGHLLEFELAFSPLLMKSLDLTQDYDLLQDHKTLQTIKNRFNLRVDDVDHADIFGWL